MHLQQTYIDLVSPAYHLWQTGVFLYEPRIDAYFRTKTGGFDFYASFCLQHINGLQNGFTVSPRKSNRYRPCLKEFHPALPLQYLTV